MAILESGDASPLLLAKRGPIRALQEQGRCQAVEPPVERHLIYVASGETITGSGEGEGSSIDLMGRFP